MEEEGEVRTRRRKLLVRTCCDDLLETLLQELLNAVDRDALNGGGGTVVHVIRGRSRKLKRGVQE